MCCTALTTAFIRSQWIIWFLSLLASCRLPLRMESDTQWPGYRPRLSTQSFAWWRKNFTFVLFGDEAWFNLSGYVRSQNNRYWSTENPVSIHEVPLYDEIECVVLWVQLDYRVHFFSDTINWHGHITHSDWVLRTLLVTVCFWRQSNKQEIVASSFARSETVCFALLEYVRGETYGD